MGMYTVVFAEIDFWLLPHGAAWGNASQLMAKRRVHQKVVVCRCDVREVIDL